MPSSGGVSGSAVPAGRALRARGELRAHVVLVLAEPGRTAAELPPALGMAVGGTGEPHATDLGVVDACPERALVEMVDLEHLLG